MKYPLILASIFLTAYASAPAPSISAPLGLSMTKYVEKSNCAQSKWAKGHFTSKSSHSSKRGILASVGQKSPKQSLRQRAKLSKVSTNKGSGASDPMATDQTSNNEASKSKGRPGSPEGTPTEQNSVPQN